MRSKHKKKNVFKHLSLAIIILLAVTCIVGGVLMYQSTYFHKNTAAVDSSLTTTTIISNPAGQPICVTSNLDKKGTDTNWQNLAFSNQKGIFTAEFDVTPSGQNIDAIVGLSNGAGNLPTDFAAIVRFNNKGFIDARNGALYAAVSSLPYSANQNYHIRMVVNPSTHAYSVYAKASGASEVTIANNYAFRTEQASTSQINNRGLLSFDSRYSINVCNFTVSITTINPLPPAPGITWSAVGSVNGGTAGTALPIYLKISNTGLLTDLISNVEIYNSSNTKVYATSTYHVNIGSTTPLQYSINWTPTTSDTYRVALKVFNNTWLTQYYSAPNLVSLYVAPTSTIPKIPDAVTATSTTATTTTVNTNFLDATFDSNGLLTYSLNGTNIINPSDRSVYVNITRFNSDGVTTYVPAQKLLSTTWDTTTKKLTKTYDWGTFSLMYISAKNNKLDIKVDIKNTSASPIATVSVSTVTFSVPYTGPSAVAFGPISPNAVLKSHSNGTVAFVGTDGWKNTTLELATAAAYPNRLVAYFENGWTATSIGSNAWRPFAYLPLGAGQSQSYNLSLRFGPVGAGIAELAPDAYQSFVAQNPFQVNWSDRRPIGQLFPAGSSATSRTGTNPRGWFNDTSIDVTTLAGLETFYNRMLNYASSSVAILKGMNAQGVITWDLEGEQYPLLTYVGDPRVAERMAPEWTYNNLIDKYFQTFTKAGIRVGMTIRPQDIKFDINNVPYAVTPADEAQNYIDKITYAKNRWGATIFYIDSNDANVILPVMKRVRQIHPDVLLIPEHENIYISAFTAPYDSLRGGFTDIPSDVKYAYPGAFYTLKANNEYMDANYSKLVELVRNGTILFFQGWYNDSGNARIKQIYTDAGKGW